MAAAVLAGTVGALGLVANRPAPPPVVEDGATVVTGAQSTRPLASAVVLPALGAANPVAANAVVQRVVDGDTLVVRVAGRDETVRLLGIDTPETHRPDTAVECFGPEAEAALAAALTPGTPVRLERDVEARDRYGRLLAYAVRAGDGLFVNAALARAGLADALAYAPNLAHADELAEAVAAARAARAGLWGACGGPHEPAPG